MWHYEIITKFSFACEGEENSRKVHYNLKKISENSCKKVYILLLLLLYWATPSYSFKVSSHQLLILFSDKY